MKVVSVVGARPQFIKAAPLSRELRRRHEEFLLHTGQHYDPNMSRIFFDELEIPRPDVNLGVGSESHAVQTAAMMEGIERILLDETPDAVLVYGDTNSTIAGALAAAKLHIPVAHVEAGLRSFNWDMPEEINRVLTDRIADFLYCPTPEAVLNLTREGLQEKATLVGDVMVDALLHFSKVAERKVNPLEKYGLLPKQYLLATIHRPANTDDPENLRNILLALLKAPLTVFFPIHPRTQKKLSSLPDLKDQLTHSNIILSEPLSYLEILLLEKNAVRIVTDSGGIQKEAFLWRVPCITLREETEWVETVEQGWNILVGADHERILHAIHHFAPGHEPDFSYGDGDTSRKIVDHLEDNL